MIENLTLKFSLLISGNEPFIAKKTRNSIELIVKKESSIEEKITTCELVSIYLIKAIQKMNLENLQRIEYRAIQQIIDEHYVFVKKVTRIKGLDEATIVKLRAQTLVLKLGGKIPVEWMINENNRPFWLFIVRNYFHQDFFALRLQLPFDYGEGPSIPIFRKGLGLVWTPFSRIMIEKDSDGKGFSFSYEGKPLFATNSSYQLGPNYCCFYNGIQKYNIYNDAKWLPHDKRNPKEWGQRYILEVWITRENVNNDRPSMFARTHAYMMLLDKDGYVRSVGQDALIDFKDYKVWEVLSRKPGYGKISTPDKFVLYPTNARKFWNVSIEISKKQHDEIIALVEKDKSNKNHSMSVMKKNCVSYTMKILREVLGFEVNGAFNGIHIFFKACLPDKWYRRFMKKFMPWYERQPSVVKKVIHFFPPFYLVFLFTAVCGRIITQNSFNGERDYDLLKVLAYPWVLEVDHPLSLHRELEKHADKEGFIQLSKEQTS